MNTLAQTSTERPSLRHSEATRTRRPVRLRQVPTSRTESRESLPVAHTEEAMLRFRSQEAALRSCEREQAQEDGLEPPPAPVPFARPRLVAVLPFALVAQLSSRRWGVYASTERAPAAEALLAGLPTELRSSKWGAMTAAQEMSDAATISELRAHTHAAAVEPLISRFGELMAQYGRAVPAAVFGEWLREMAGELRATCSRLRDEHAEGVPNEFAILGQVASIALEQGVVR